MDFTTFALIGAILYGVYALINKRMRYFRDLAVPFVPPLPIFGYMAASVFRRKHMNVISRELYNSHPDAKYVGAFDFMSPVFVIRDPDIIKNITIKNFDCFEDRMTFFKLLKDPLFDGNLFTLTGDKWRETRNLLTPTFTSSKLKSMFNLILACTENCIQHVSKLSEDPKNCINAKDLFTRHTNDVIASCAFGISVDSFNEPDNQFYKVAKKGTNFEGFTFFKMILAKVSPWLFNKMGVTFSDKSVVQFFTDVVKRTIENRDQTGSTRPDMIQLMMDARGKTSDSLELDLRTMTAQAFVFLLGGFETTSTQLCIMAQELTVNPEIQERLQAEIDSVLAETDGELTYESITAMPYLDAVLNESVRRHTQVDTIDRVCVKPFTLPAALPGRKPITLQPGQDIKIPTVGIHLDEHYHSEPEQFKPERYLDKKVALKQQVDSLGFGIGPRSCIGNRFGALEIKTLMVLLLSKFSLRPNEKTARDFTYDPSSFSLAPKGGYWLTVEPRLL